MATQTELAYLAGIIDGEGCFSITIVRSKRRATLQFAGRICVSTTSERMIKRCHEIAQCGTVSKVKFYESNPGRQQRWSWMTSYKTGSELCKRILPFLVEKKEQAEIFIDFEKSMSVGRKFLGRGDDGGLPKWLVNQRRELKEKLNDLTL